ncbi:outer membrane beta-barrel protein [Mangrovimonas spongiae]|uniref:Uncharacterized protein n=1 Tax=Mangrovimonas spongiae TaxID=2494697 RepID=A0A428K4V1_9FLAO|nr:outer membrane beta-barrel protein [Mangrovimonas spongiae]RSK41466.1 hypothetical protein EJA19_00915 [Mangrovimonas spongiae]
MSDKKHIDRIFQEKFKDFEASPGKHVWENIQNELHQSENNKKPKAIPFWLKLSSVAAILIFILALSGLLQSDFNEREEKKPAVVNTSTTNIETREGNSPSYKETLDSNTSKNILIKKDGKQENLLTQEQNIKTEHSISTPSKTASNNALTKTGNTVSNTKNITKSTEGQTGTNTNKTQKITQLANTNQIPVNTRNHTNSLKQNNTYKTSKERNVSSSTTKNSITKIESYLSPNLETTIPKNKITTDTLIIHTGNAIEKAIAMAKEAEQNNEEENVANRWQVSANIAPVYYNSFGDGSHIDEQFVGNSKTGEVNTSYGVNVSYAMNKKWALRTGVNSLKLSYDTNGVILYESAGNQQVSPLKNVSLSSNNQNIAAISSNTIQASNVPEIFSQNYNAAISQRLSYFEIPIEVEYKLLESRLGIQVIGGVSTFFLDDNQIYSEFDGYKTQIGKANNINDLSFSGNLGLGFNYKFTDTFKFNLEPTFKYQFNAYENTSGNFNPYIIGVYSGFSFRF